MFCGQCGTEASEGDRYCSSCGRLLGDTPTGAPREVATGGEPGLSWAGRGPASVGSGAASDEQALVPASEAVLAGFWLRLGAFAIDMAAWWGFSLAVAIVVVGIYFGQNGVPEDGNLLDGRHLRGVPAGPGRRGNSPRCVPGQGGRGQPQGRLGPGRAHRPGGQCG